METHVLESGVYGLVRYAAKGIFKIEPCHKTVFVASFTVCDDAL